MPMTFESLKARRHLLEKGYVYTLRCFPHRQGEDVATWFKGTVIGKVKITLLKEFTRKIESAIKVEPTVYDFLRGSGFSSLLEWRNEILKMNHIKELPDILYLYSVQLVV